MTITVNDLYNHLKALLKDDPTAGSASVCIALGGSNSEDVLYLSSLPVLARYILPGGVRHLEFVFFDALPALGAAELHEVKNSRDYDTSYIAAIVKRFSTQVLNYISRENMFRKDKPALTMEDAVRYIDEIIQPLLDTKDGYNYEPVLSIIRGYTINTVRNTLVPETVYSLRPENNNESTATDKQPEQTGGGEPEKREP